MLKTCLFAAIFLLSAGSVSGESSFNQSYILQGISFHVTCPNSGSTKQFTIKPIGLAIDNSIIDQEIQGTVTGGISLGYEALQEYLQEHPEENKKIDGFTPEQCCFLTWAQLWTTIENEDYLRQIVSTDTHAAGAYQTIGPSQHEAGFYKAFNIQPGDPMWLDKKDRVNIW